MAKYNVWFTVNGVPYFTTGTSSYPTIQELRDGTYSEKVAFDSAMMFVSGYMDVMRINGKVDVNSICFTMEQDNDE